MTQSALTSEMATWSTKLLTQLVEEEDCSMVVRNAAINALSLRSAPGSGNTVTLTSDLLHAAATNNGGWTRAQLATLGIKYPPRSGWLRNLVGQTIPAERWNDFVAANKIKRKSYKPV